MIFIWMENSVIEIFLAVISVLTNNEMLYKPLIKQWLVVKLQLMFIHFYNCYMNGS